MIVHLTVSLKKKLLTLYKNNQKIKSWPVAVGAPSTPTPTGIYRIKNKISNPGGSPYGVLGSRWMGLTIPGGNYGIHGTNNPASIGREVSRGCIRMLNKDIEELFPQVPLWSRVIITKD
ncbi:MULTISPECIES: L,D-transpeptidase [Carboxydothermus]|nr:MULTISPECIES: L,D-transpeptidase [Carboxydothermus]NYE57401.1 lipoprotein-anchoring transpeptidase ErfK/SrfK [Carboxydothermus ferrireducens DSM 11255]